MLLPGLANRLRHWNMSTWYQPFLLGLFCWLFLMLFLVVDQNINFSFSFSSTFRTYLIVFLLQTAFMISDCFTIAGGSSLESYHLLIWDFFSVPVKVCQFSSHSSSAIWVVMLWSVSFSYSDHLVLPVWRFVQQSSWSLPNLDVMK